MDTRTRIIVAAELATQGLSISAIARQLDRHRETVGLWLHAIRIEGLSAFLDRYAEAKKGPRRGRQVPGTVKRLVWAIRLREHNCCGRRFSIFWSVNRIFISPSPRSRRSWPSAMSYGLAAGRISRGESCRRPRPHARSFKW